MALNKSYKEIPRNMSKLGIFEILATKIVVHMYVFVAIHFKKLKAVIMKCFHKNNSYYKRFFKSFSISKSLISSNISSKVSANLPILPKGVSILCIT